MLKFAWLTPAAPAAIAIVRCDLHDGIIKRALPSVGRACFAHLRDADGDVIDEVVIVRVDEQRVEIQCHGGVGMRAAVGEALISHGFTEGDAALPDAWTNYARLVHPAALALMGTCEPQELWFRQPLVLITGPANAGKSTLLNTWCGHQRALVSDQPGTTRDLLAAVAEVRGWRLQLIDSAGLRKGAKDLEQAGQELVSKARGWVDAVILVNPDPNDLSFVQDNDIVVSSKWDLHADATPTKGLVWSAPEFSDSARSAQQLDLLGHAVLEHLSLPWSLPSEDDK